jgi:hypothetical protein
MPAQSISIPSLDQQSRQRERWFQHGRMVPGQSAAALRYRAHRQKIQLRALNLAQTRIVGMTALPRVAVGAAWTPLGPAPLASDATGLGVQDYGPVAGRATAVAVDPADGTGNTVYVGGAYGGVWKSTNAGPLSPNPASVTWVPLTDDQATLAIGSIAIQPQLSSPDARRSVILAGTGEANSSFNSYYGLGILRSANAGASWSLISQDTSGRPFAGLGFSKIAFSTLDPTQVVAAAAGATRGVTEGLESPVIANRGLYFSHDSGVSWSLATVSDASAVIDPSSATAVVYNAAAHLFFAAIQWHGIYSSADGSVWTRLGNQPGGLSPVSCPASPVSSSCALYRGEFAVVPGRNEMYFWYVDSNNTDKQIWQTRNAGVSWTQLHGDGIANCGDVLGGCGTEQGVYNLELAAVPDGEVTDLYAGAVNLYKCRITTASPTCDHAPPDTFVNLTHAFGCPPNLGSIAHVHPNQHGLSFLPINSNMQVVMYFANDGGIYRALDGYTGLTTGACGGSNQFDSLNENLAPGTVPFSLMQFVSFSQHPTDPNTILGGAEDNGSPASSRSQSATNWVNVNAGDGGYTEINPDNPFEWFTANNNVTIQRCASATDCRAQDFSSGLVVSSATLGGDSGPFFTPYILDPQNSGELLVGTCRVWRGATDGSGFSLLTDNLDSGGSASCTGGEINQVRSLAAGGLKDTAGFSNVMYAGTDGLGPLSPGGHVWVATNVSGGAGAWLDRTGATNPSGFPVSAIALDRSDTTGNTAYMAIMGFHVSHIWKTTNAGSSWIDFTQNLPDAPANAVLVDPSANQVYAATDVGVFVSATANPAWTEVGASAGAGFLPNVAVTALRMFNFGGTKKLRASTYGRGLWEFTLSQGPDYLFASPINEMTVFAGESAAFNLTLSAENGFNSAVNLSCIKRTPNPPPACTFTPSVSVTPTTSGTQFAVNAGGAVGDYFFNVHGVGTDLNTIIRDFSLTLHVVDFALTVPAPASVTMTQASTSSPVVFQVIAAGAFTDAVALSCGLLPPGVSCSFARSNSVAPLFGSPASSTLTLTTSSSTPTGTTQITINGSVAGGPIRTQHLSLTVTAAGSTTPDFAVAISNPSLTVNPNEAGVFNGTLTASSSYSSPVNLRCAGAVPLTCTASPSSLTPTSAGAAFTVTASNDTENHFNFTIDGNGTDAGRLHRSTSVELIVGFNFVINNDSPAQTISAGQSASYNLDAVPLGNGSVFPANVMLSCSGAGMPPLSTCAFTPAQVASGLGTTNLVLKISTTAASTKSARLENKSPLLWYDLSLSLAGVVALGRLHKTRTKRKRIYLRLGVLGVVLVFLTACGNGSSGGGSGSAGGGVAGPGTTAGNYTITVNAAVGSITRNVDVALIVQ